MATEIEPEHVEQQQEEVPARRQRMKDAFKEQRGHVGARVKEWLATGDIDDVDIIQIATLRKQAKHDEKVRQQQRTAAEHHARFAVAKARIEAEDGNVNSRHLARLAGEVASAESKLAAIQAEPVLPPTDREINNVRHGKKAGRAATLAGGTLAAFPAIGAAAEQAATGQPLLLAALGTAAGYGWYLVSRPFVDGQPAPAPLIPEQLATPVNMLKKEPGGRDFNAPPPPALTAEELDQALRNIGEVRPNEQIQILAVPQRDREGNTTVVFDLPPRTKVANLVRKIEEFAGALGRDSSMIDVTKAGTELRTSLWMTDRDPFEDVRPSPLIKSPSQLDAFQEGVPIGWAKRGNTIRLPIRSSNIAIGGGTRSGKGVGASNVVVGASFDPRINLRIVAGKENAEWNAYAKAGVAATYFKPDPDRLVALLEAELADMKRREAALNDLGKSKLVAPVIEQLGGIELIVIDELATYTRSGKRRREEIMEQMVNLASVAVGAGIMFVIITQYPNADVFPTELAINFTTKWAMRVDSARQSNAILGEGSSGQGRDASKFDPPRPGLGWLVNPFVGITDKARSFDIDEDERGEISTLQEKAAKIREKAGRLAGQWEDPIEKHLLNATGLSSMAGGPERNGVPGRAVHQATPSRGSRSKPSAAPSRPCDTSTATRHSSTRWPTSSAVP
ncbi:hypothetical protein J4032_22075 [Streptomyces formicae]|uniref:FtsK domain-containing protein n=1 Tax=Streptomyces formicae TaxID=1616117 RepID=A0ABY3WMF5_9ACTN|nr:hypothetical protein [Streptomyces formicae]UNM13786.1 hypothetical protein J4032_22075 [Streptomyces formicae]